MEPTNSEETHNDPVATEEQSAATEVEPNSIQPKTTKPLFAPNNPKDTKLGKRHQSATKARPKRRVKTKRPVKKKKKKR